MYNCEYEYHRDRNSLIVIDYRESLSGSKHFHNCIEFIYIISGDVIAHIDETEYHFSSGQMCIVSSFSTHYYETLQTGQFIVCLIPRRYYRETDSIFNNNCLQNPVITDSGTKPILNIIQQIGRIITNEDIWGESAEVYTEKFKELQLFHLSSYLVNTFINRCGLYERKRISSLVADAIGIIETDFKTPINVSTICTKLNCSQRDLSYNFKRTLNMTILDYIERTRLTEATRLLRQYPHMTNDQVMLESGYKSNRTFLRDFKDIYHCTPTEYRKKHSSM